MNPRLLAIDLDGTLLDPAGRIPAAGREQLERARAAGIEIVIATGRSWAECRSIIDTLELEGVMISAGGAMLADVRDGRTIERVALDPPITEYVTERLLEAGHLVHLLQDATSSFADYIMVGGAEPDPATRWWLQEHALDVHSSPVLQPDLIDHTVRAGSVGPAGSLEDITRDLEAEIGDKACIRHWEAVVEANSPSDSSYMLEVFAPGVNKWSMLESVLRQRGIDPDDVVAIGDGLNDIELLHHAGHGVAMGQAKEAVREAADQLVASNAEGGFAQAIRSILPA